MKLAAKLILIFLCGVLAIVSLFAWQTINRQQASENARLGAHASDLVQALTPEIMRAYQDGARVTIQQAVEVSAHTVPGSQLRWVDARIPALSETQFTSRQVTSFSISDANGQRTALFYVPFTMDGKDTGAIEVAQPLAEQDALTRNSLFASILSLLGVSGLSAIVIYLGGIQLVGKPLDKLIEQVNLIGEGHLAQPPALHRNDELGRLALAISQMSHRLKAQLDTIRHTDRLGTVGTLAAGVAHELGTPLNVVSGRAGLIASGKLSADEVTCSANTIKSESERMTNIIRQLLDFARQRSATHSPVDLGVIAKRTCDLMQTLASKSGSIIQTDCASSVAVVEGDATQLQQVLTNLISNAIGAMPKGGVVSVNVCPADSNGRVLIYVSDSGVGIDSKNLSRVFEPFYTTKDVGQGTGLGLSIAYGIVAEHGGDLSVTSEPGRQTSFRVSLPSAASNPIQRMQS